MSYIKFIKAADSPIPDAWRYNADQAYMSLSDDERAYFVFDQVLAIRYLYLAYGGGIPTLIRNYGINVWEKVRSLITQKEAYERSDSKTKLEKQSFIELVSIIVRIAGGWTIENTQSVCEWVRRNARSTGNYPKAIIDIPTCLAFYDTFIKYLNPTLRNNGFTTRESVSLPSIALIGQSITFGYGAVHSNYNMNKQLRNNLVAAQIPLNSFFDFISGFNPSSNNGMMSLIGILATYSLDLDSSWLYVNYSDSPQILDNPRSKFGLMETVRNTSNESKIFNFLRRSICRFEPYIQTPFDTLETRSETSFRRLFISFLIVLRRQYHLTFEDNEIAVLSSAMGEGEDGLKDYLKSSPGDVSVEAINAFNDSVFSEFPELHLENRVTHEYDDLEIDTQHRDTAALKENLKAMRTHDAAITGPAPLRDATNDVDKSDAKSAASKGLDQALDSMPTDDSTEQGGNANGDLTDQGNESGDSGATGDDDTPGTKSDNGKEESTDKDNTEKSDTGDSSDTTRDKISMHPVPDIAKVSDKEGVKLELTSSETTDTVFYRMELKAYIDSILNNPPRTISQQKIQVLKKIEAFWLNIITPQCLYDLISSVIKLPSEFKIHKGKK